MTLSPHRLVRQSRPYPVFIGSGLLPRLGEIAAEIDESAPWFVIVSQNVAHLHEEKIRAGRQGAAALIGFTDGEQEKTLANVESLVTRMLQAGVRRDWLAFLVGGGVVGDAAGFACSIYMRGIRAVHVPTTLLAQVDSSIGGKVAVNHPSGKNLVGAFAPPAAVVSDLDLLLTLPREEFVSGLCESLKGGVIADQRLFEIVAAGGPELQSDPKRLREIVWRSVDVKAAIVERDEREGGERRLLNYGHTFGHGVEAALGFSGLTHGEAIAWGMVAANAVAVRRGLLTRFMAEKINDAVIAIGVRPLPELSAERVFLATGFDKKFEAGQKVLVLAEGIGQCRVIEDATDEEIRFGIEAMIERSRTHLG